MTADFIRQCELRRAQWVTVTWLPDKESIVGNTVKFRDLDGEWTVAVVYERIEDKKLSRRNHCVAV